MCHALLGGLKPAPNWMTVGVGVLTVHTLNFKRKSVPGLGLICGIRRLPVDQALDRFLEFTPACPNPWPLPSLRGHQLQHLCHQAIKKAPGLDCWLAKSWDCLPLEFFDKLANLWNSCLQGATLPQQWKHVRIALIPKNDGGMRPLAIGDLAWQLSCGNLDNGLFPGSLQNFVGV